MRLVFDTSSLVPACLYPERQPARIFRRTLLAHEVLASVETFDELAAVLARDKFDAWQSRERRLAWIRLFREAATWVETVTPVTECRDPKDNKFLALALSAKAEILVSSDIHLLGMHPFRGVRILSLADFSAFLPVRQA
jgi:putative PIN family toxin of toxin-antitoxin system